MDTGENAKSSTGEFPSFWKARYDFEGNPDGMQLSFRKGDTFLVTCLHEGGWFTAERNRRKGYVPSNYLERIEEGELTKSEPVARAPTKEMSEVLPPRMRSVSPAVPKPRSFSGGPAIAIPPSTSGHKSTSSTSNLPVVPPRRGTRGNTPNLTVRVPPPGSVSPSSTPPSTPPSSFTVPMPHLLPPPSMGGGGGGNDTSGAISSPIPSPSVPVPVLEDARQGEGTPPPLPQAVPTQFRPPALSTVPSIPLRPDQGELACDRQEPSSCPSEEAEYDKELLLSGVPFTRYVRKGKPSKKLIALDASCVKLLWKDYEKKRLEGFIMLDDVIATKRGHVQKKATKVADPEMSLSIICSDENKTLELEAESQEMRDRWLRNFDKLLLMHSKQRLG